MLNKVDEKIVRQAGIDPDTIIVRFHHDPIWNNQTRRWTSADIYLKDRWLETPKERRNALYAVAGGIAFCNLSQDQFRKDVGRTKALGRACAAFLKVAKSLSIPV